MSRQRETLADPEPETSAGPLSEEHSVAMQKALLGLRMVCANLPWLSGLATIVRVSCVDWVPVAAVSPFGRVVINPKVFASLPLSESMFVMAHELLHLALDTHKRRGESNHRLVNIAHDYVINDILRDELQMQIPLGALDYPGASEKSLEQLISEVKSLAQHKLEKLRSWSSPVAAPPPPSRGTLGAALRDAGLVKDDDSVQTKRIREVMGDFDEIPPDLAKELFPEDADPANSLPERILREAARSLALRTIERTMSPHRGTEPGSDLTICEALRDAYRVPWEAALQRWMESVAPARRSYSRPSRRGADRTDCVRPGRLRDGWTLHVILDTSGSMIDELSKALGAIASFCEASGVVEIHLLQCDVNVTVDEVIPVENLHSYTIQGLGGSDMSAAMHQLTDNYEVTAAVIITDGDIAYPEAEPPYHVLWCLTGNPELEFPYGDVVRCA
ncbi:MAG: DUF2201 family putative metallopeptidase [Planctomycetaceae bacterium]